MARLSILLVFTLLFSISCKQKKEEENLAQLVAIEGLAKTVSSEGKRLMEQKCYLCHSPSAPEQQGRIAPPMIAVKAHYQQNFESREAFIAAMVNFVLEPQQEKVQLRGAARRFGLMPKALYEREEIEKIAAYLYDYQIEEPDWFEEHWSSHGFEPYTNKSQQILLTKEEKPTHAEVGMSYALSTKKVLGEHLMGTIQKEGAPAAVAFCNERAYPLTDSMALNFKAKIKRVSDKPRNPKNQANNQELTHIETFKKVVASSEEIKPIVEDLGEQVQFYAPILTNDMCLKCHGSLEDNVSLEVQNLLHQKYPNDQATGYGINEVRGIWSITFDKQENVKF